MYNIFVWPSRILGQFHDRPAIVRPGRVLGVRPDRTGPDRHPAAPSFSPYSKYSSKYTLNSIKYHRYFTYPLWRFGADRTDSACRVSPTPSGSMISYIGSSRRAQSVIKRTGCGCVTNRPKYMQATRFIGTPRRPATTFASFVAVSTIRDGNHFIAKHFHFGDGKTWSGKGKFTGSMCPEVMFRHMPRQVRVSLVSGCSV